MLEYAGGIALFLLLLQIALIGWLVLGEHKNRDRLKQYVAVSFFNVLLIAFFWLGNRITEITFSSVGTIKAQADQASQYVGEIKRIRSEVEQEQQTIKGVAATAQTASSLSKELEVKNGQASKQLIDLANQMAAAAKTNERLQLIVQYATIVLAAQTDDRAAFDQLQSWSTDNSFPYAVNAKRASLGIEDQLENLMLDYHVPWGTGVDPARFKIGELRKIYSSAEFANVVNLRVGLVQYVASRSDISQKDRLQFLIDVMRQDSSLKVVAYAGQAFAQVANLDNSAAPGTHMRPLALPFFFAWWKDNASKLP